MATYRVYSLDVWGNETDGFEVNDRRQIGTVEIEDDTPDGSILGRLQAKGYLDESLSIIDVCIDGDDEVIFIDTTHTGYPLLQLFKK